MSAVDQIKAKTRMVCEEPDSIGVLSTGEQIAVAFVLDDQSILHEVLPGTSMLDALDRLGPEWTAAAMHVQREGWRS